MAQPPITFLERKWSAQGSSNSLIKAATQTTQREQISMLDDDTHRNVSRFGRRTLQTIGRFLYWNCPPIRTAIDEMARLAVSSFIPQFYGKDKKWGKEAEEFLYESDKFLDVRGWPYTGKTYLQNLVREVLVDGDQGTLLAEVDGSAKVQVWRSHKIGSQSHIQQVQGGEYDGAIIIDGVVVNEFGRPIAYALQHAPGMAPFKYVPAKDFMLNFLPNTSDSIRGLSAIGTAAFPMMDRDESKNFLLLGQKLSATYAVEIQNATGMVDRGKSAIQAGTTAADTTTGTAGSLPTELRKPGTITYFKAGTGQQVKVVDQNQPGENALNFQGEIIRESLQSAGWSFDFSHDPTKAGGAQMRIVIEKIEARLKELRDYLVGPVCLRRDGWRISKAIKSGMLRDNDEWFKIGYQGPARLTADRKYDSEIDLEETARGLMTDAKACGNRGDYWEETYDQKETETDSKWERAERLAKKRKIDIVVAYDSLWKPNANPPAVTPELEKDTTEEIKKEMDAYGVGVRAGAITPSVSDEDHFRAKFGLPTASPEVKSNWSKEKNVRRPITLTQIDGQKASPFGGGGGKTEGGEDE